MPITSINGINCQSINQSINQSIQCNQSINQSINQSQSINSMRMEGCNQSIQSINLIHQSNCNQSINQSHLINQSINQSFQWNQSINQSDQWINQSINQSMQSIKCYQSNQSINRAKSIGSHQFACRSINHFQSPAYTINQSSQSIERNQSINCFFNQSINHLGGTQPKSWFPPFLWIRCRHMYIICCMHGPPCLSTTMAVDRLLF